MDFYYLRFKLRTLRKKLERTICKPTVRQVSEGITKRRVLEESREPKAVSFHIVNDKNEPTIPINISVTPTINPVSRVT